MGIVNLKKLIGHVAVRRHLSSYSGKRLAFDTSIWLYQFNYNDQPHAVLEGILRQLRQCHRYQITPVYVFDGKASSEIKIEIEKRQQRRQRVQESLETLGLELEETLETLGDPVSAAIVMGEIDGDAGVVQGNAKIELPFGELDVPMFIPDSDDEEYAALAPTLIETPQSEVETTEDLMTKAVRLQSRMLSLQKQVRRPTREIVDECKRIFELLGVPYRQSPGESDVTLAEMYCSGEVDGIVSEDTDMLPYGCNCFLTEFKYNSEYVTEFNLAKVLEDLEMTREQFVDLCILCGCDYSEKIYKIAIKGALEKIRLYNTIEGVLEHIQSQPKLAEKHTYAEDFMDQVQRARNMFLTRNAEGAANALPEPVKQTWNFEVAQANEKDFQQFIKDHDMSQTAYSMLSKPWAGVAKGQQTLLKFFSKK